MFQHLVIINLSFNASHIVWLSMFFLWFFLSFRLIHTFVDTEATLPHHVGLSFLNSLNLQLNQVQMHAHFRIVAEKVNVTDFEKINIFWLHGKLQSLSQSDSMRVMNTYIFIQFEFALWTWVCTSGFGSFSFGNICLPKSKITDERNHQCYPLLLWITLPLLLILSWETNNEYLFQFRTSQVQLIFLFLLWLKYRRFSNKDYCFVF